MGRLLRYGWIAVLMLCSTQARAVDFSTTNAQVLYGSNFHDTAFGYNTVDGNLTPLTLDHFSTWAYGDNYFFVDLLAGDFADANGKSTGKTTRIYSEWHPSTEPVRIVRP